MRFLILAWVLALRAGVAEGAGEAEQSGVKKPPVVKESPMPAKQGPAEALKPLIEKEKAPAALRVEGGRVYYEGRDVDKELERLRADLDRSYALRKELLNQPKADLKRLELLEREIRGMEGGLKKYEALRERALQEGAAETAASEGQGTAEASQSAARDERADASAGAGVSGGGGGDAELPPPPGRGPRQIQGSRLDERRLDRSLSGAAAGRDLLGEDLGGRERAAALDGDGGPEEPFGGPRPAADEPREGGPDPANPRTRAELVMASLAGFAASFARQGLAVGEGPDGARAVLDKDGRPAAPERLAALRRDILAEPRALMKRPDFFAVLPRETFTALKEERRRPPESRSPAFKHIGLSAGERDFLWSESCSRLAGGCNPAARRASYKKEEFVAPEELDAVWDALIADAEQDLEREDQEADLAAVDEARRKLGRRALAGGRGRNLIDAAASFFSGLWGDAPDAGAGAAGAAPAEDAPAVAAGEIAGGGASPGAVPRAPLKARSVPGARTSGAPARTRRLPLLPAVATVASFWALLWVLRRRRRRPT